MFRPFVVAAFLVFSVLSVPSVAQTPSAAQITTNPFPTPIEATQGVILVRFVEFAVIPDADDSVANIGAGDLPENISAPSASVVIGNGGGSGLGNAAIAPNIARFIPGQTDSLIAGVIVG